MTAHTPLHIEIYRDLKSRILNHDFLPGAQLPTEHELAASFRVSRITAHRALQRLAVEGWIMRRRGKGSFVSIKPTSGTADTSLDSPGTEGPSRLIGFILPDVSEWYGMNLLSSVIRMANESDCSVVVGYSAQSQAEEERAIRRMLGTGVNGLLIYPVNGEFYNQEILRLSLTHFPLVLVDRNLTKIPVPYVSTDHRAAAVDLTEHLIALGHQHIGFLSPDISGTVPLEERFAGYTRSLEQHGMSPVDSQWRPLGLPTGSLLKSVDPQPIYDVLRTYLLKHPDMTAVVVTEYQYAAMLHNICVAHGIAVPGKSVV